MGVRSWRTRLRPELVVAAAAVWAVLARVPWLTAPPGADEGGLLLLAGQWRAGGSSLYGDYWVDRPPLLLALFQIADSAGGVAGAVPALRLLGCLAAASAVVLAAAVASRLGGRRTAAWAAVAAAAFMSMPGLTQQVPGELLALPWVLAGFAAFLAAGTRSGNRRTFLMLLAGGCGAAAFAVKQSFLDVFVLVAASLAGRAVARRPVGGPARDLLAVTAGAAAATTALLALAAARGTSPAGLWDAIVLFRLDATTVIAERASDATGLRLARYPAALLASGAAAVGGLLAVRTVRAVARRRVDRRALTAAAVLAWEAFAVVAGGSYWLHYLLGLVPGLVLAVAVLTRRPGRLARAGRIAVGWAAAFAVAGSVYQAAHPPAPSVSAVAGEWLSRHRSPGDTAVVAYGQPNILAEAGTPSPYPLIWSLPVRVRDPHLHRLARVLRSDRAPDWLLVWRRLDTWGVDPAPVARAVRGHYRRVADVCGWVVYLRDGVRRAHGPAGHGAPPPCPGTGAAASPAAVGPRFRAGTTDPGPRDMRRADAGRSPT